MNRPSHHRGSKDSPTRFRLESQGDLVQAASRSSGLCVTPPFSPSAQAKPGVDVCDLHCGEEFFLLPSLFISKARWPRGVVLLISIFVCLVFYYAFFAITLLTRLQAAADKKKKSIFSFGRNNTAFCCRFSSPSQFQRSARPRPQPPHARTISHERLKSGERLNVRKLKDSSAAAKPFS